MVALLLYTYPTIVTLAAIRLGRAQASRRTTAALVLTSIGLALVLAGAAAGTIEAIGALLALTGAVVYAAYILTAEGPSKRLDPLVLSTLVCTGAALTLTVSSRIAGDLKPGAVTGDGLVWLLAIALVSTVAGIALFFAGLGRVGPSAASILSTFEPLCTVGLAALALGENLTVVQLIGGGLILSGVIALNLRRRSRPAPIPAIPVAPYSDSLSSSPRR
jgi:drug/metabolite transporter (DMT)-like permease